MKTLRHTFLLLGTVAFLFTTTSCSLFKKKEEDDGLSRWNDDLEKPSRWQKWKKWENEKADNMWRKFRDS